MSEALRPDGSIRWYDLFSRGARDWLRHNEKVREAVRERLPEIISGSDILGGGGNRRVRVPVKFLEHYRFRLRPPDSENGVGQGEVRPGDILRPARPGEGPDKGAGGSEDGGVQFVLEFKVDDIVDWLWEELALPNLKPKTGGMSEEDYQREGWDRRGARSRLDRRRSIKEAIKRRAVQPQGPSFTDEDLRFRQLVKRRTPTTQAVVFFAMDVSASMTERDRQLAKTFFFWVIQGLRRQYRQLEAVFVAHTAQAWEFSEEEFFQVSGTGGTIASTAFLKVKEIVDERFDPSRYNIYLFYGSDGENYPRDREPTEQALASLIPLVNFVGYLEVSPTAGDALETEMGAVFAALSRAGAPVDRFALNAPESVWEAIRRFLKAQAGEEAA